MNSFNNYLGKWLVNDQHDSEKCTQIECIGINESDRSCNFIDDEGNRFTIKMFDLDNSNGKYEKVYSIYDAPDRKENVRQIASSLKDSAPKSKMLGDLSKIGSSKMNESLREKEYSQEDYNEQRQSTKETSTQHVYRNDNDPIATFISSAIQLSRKMKKESVIPIKIDLKLDFDILSIISSAMQLGASDIEILQHIFNDVNIELNDVKQAIFNELLKSPEDVDIAMSDRENKFNETLNEELEKEDKPTYEEL